MWKRIAIASGLLAILFAVLLGQSRRRTSVLANMTDEGIVRYVEATVTHGEFATLQGLTAAP